MQSRSKLLQANMGGRLCMVAESVSIRHMLNFGNRETAEEQLNYFLQRERLPDNCTKPLIQSLLDQKRKGRVLCMVL